MIAAVRMSPIASLSLPRIGAWSASLTIHLAILALLLSAPAAIRLVQQVKAEQRTVVHFIEPKPIEVLPAMPQPAPHHTTAAPAHHVAPVAATQAENTSVSPPPADAIPTMPSVEVMSESPAQDVAPSAIAYGSKTSVPYPVDSLRRHEQGTVILRVLVDADGKVLTVEIETSSGSPRLDRAARDAVKFWSFNPAKHGGIALSAWARVPVSFNLSTL